MFSVMSVNCVCKNLKDSNLILFEFLSLGVLGTWDFLSHSEKRHVTSFKKGKVFYQYENAVKNNLSVPLTISVELLA